MLKQRIGFIGAGQMATALGQGFVKAELVAGEKIVASDPVPEARERFAQATGGRTTADNLEAVAGADVLFLAVKPQQMAAVLDGLRGKVTAVAVDGRDWDRLADGAFLVAPQAVGDRRIVLLIDEDEIAR